MDRNWITKSDFLMYLNAPMHMWAQTHDLLESVPSPLAVLMMNQGYAVEEHANSYLTQRVRQSYPGASLEWQRTFNTETVSLRTDALIQRKESRAYDLYEVKSGTQVNRDYVYDAAFQFFVLREQIGVPLERVFILHLDREYKRDGSLDAAGMFAADDVTEQVIEILPEIEQALPLAIETGIAGAPDGIPGCLNPNSCPCPSLCHPDLPEGSIFEIPGMRRNRKEELLAKGITLITQIPPDYKLPAKQRLAVEVMTNNKSYIEIEQIQSQLRAFTPPFYFLDYESCISAIPLYDGYHPQQQVVFQYSLHRMDMMGGELHHSEFIDLVDHDPTADLLAQLEDDIGASGTVFVWNKTFEVTQNKEMALLHPEFANFIEALNNRIFDLADIIKKGWYLHPGFKGKWSLKSVLPVMVPELSYQTLEINKGDQASAAWWNITQKRDPDQDAETVRSELSAYCELDTLAMVRILEGFASLAGM